MSNARKSVIIICGSDSYSLNGAREIIRFHFKKHQARFAFIHRGSKLMKYINDRSAKELADQIICSREPKPSVLNQIIGQGVDYTVVDWCELRDVMQDMHVARAYYTPQNSHDFGSTMLIDKNWDCEKAILFLCKEVPSMEEREYIAQRAGCLANRVTDLRGNNLMTSNILTPIAMFIKTDVQAYYKFVHSRGERNVKAMTWNVHSVYAINSDKVVRYCPSQSANPILKGFLPLQLTEPHLLHSKRQFIDPDLYALAFNKQWSEPEQELTAHDRWLQECGRQPRKIPNVNANERESVVYTVMAARNRLPKGMQEHTKNFILKALDKGGHVNGTSLNNAIELYETQMEQWKKFLPR